MDLDAKPADGALGTRGNGNGIGASSPDVRV